MEAEVAARSVRGSYYDPLMELLSITAQAPSPGEPPAVVGISTLAAMKRASG
jgi:hypothetical protein